MLGTITLHIINAVADVAEKHKMPMVGVVTATPKGRKFSFSVGSPVEVWLEGLLDVAAKKGLKTVALIGIGGDDVGGRALIQGAIELAKKKGLQVVLVDAYPVGTTDFSAILTKVRAANPDVLGVSTPAFEDMVAITRRMKALDVNPRMVGFTAGPAALLKFYEVLGRDAEFVYVASPWLPELVEVRAGGLIPIARQCPRAREFVESSRKEFPGVSAPQPTTSPVRFWSRPSGASGLWTARSSATPFQRWTTTPSTVDSGSIVMGSRSGTRCCRSSGRTARERSSGPKSWRPTSRASPRRRGTTAHEQRQAGFRRRGARRAGWAVAPAAERSRRSGSARRLPRPGRMRPRGRIGCAGTSSASSTRTPRAASSGGSSSCLPRRQVGPRRGRPCL